MMLSDFLQEQKSNRRQKRDLETHDRDNLPCQELIDDSTDNYIDICVPLYKASITGDWEAANDILKKRTELVRFAITENCDTALHVAVSAETKLTESYVKNLMKMMTNEDLELRNKDGCTAFCYAVAVGNVEMCMHMTERNHKLLDIPTKDGMMPMHWSAKLGKYHALKYLYDKSNKMSGDHWTTSNRESVLVRCVESGFFDVALQIVEDCPGLAENATLYTKLAQKPDAFDRVGEKLITRIIKSICRFKDLRGRPDAEEDTDALKLLRLICRKTVRGKEKYTVDTILVELQYSSFVAAELGNTRFVVELLRAYPEHIHKKNEYKQTIFHIAVMHRHHDIYNLLYEIGMMRELIPQLVDEDGNNMLHLVGKTSVDMRSHTSGASILLQRELLWFHEIEKIMPAANRHVKNKNGQTPHELFFTVNQDLVSKGLDWMKDCMVVATLIVTVAFAVAFTVPGGYNQEHGPPIFIHNRTFLVFAIADAISLCNSTISLLVFLSILTTRHDQRDFMDKLPKKLMIGLVTLFIAVAALMVTFSASFYVLYHKGLKWVPILIAAFSVVPVIVFAALQFHLLVDMFRSMYDSHYLFKPKKRMLYRTNPRF